MTGLVRQYARILQRELQCRPVWLPIITTVDVGDYGIITGGTFQRLGNLARDYPGLEVAASEGPPARLNFISSSARIVRVAGEAEVPAFAAGTAGDGRLEVHFDDAQSFLLKARQVTRRQLDNVAQIARALSTTHRKSWRFLGHVFVTEVLVGHDVVFLSTRSANTRVTFSGQVEALRAIDAFGASADVSVAWNHEVGLDLVGKTGAIGLNLARVRWLTGGVVRRGEDDPAEDLVEWQDPDEDIDDTL